ncbi:MAG: hypothetical protein EOL86_10625 [Deltaproteobacteria bacterium]|nr:hypothetical protein [Deltaproteobacteria bacterium]
MSSNRQRINELFILWAGSNLQTQDGFLNMVTGGRPLAVGDRARVESMRAIWRELPKQQQDLFFKGVL